MPTEPATVIVTATVRARSGLLSVLEATASTYAVAVELIDGQLDDDQTVLHLRANR
ncbi:hypothetical protein [Leifsonia sp. Leaf264]|uniref:hypothetical protein n=1 Tax=Leifsonia sp. Leaf264 TaxID=1736314 RepID=UPI000A62E8F9|nr:hypothetical protein [Leifsonia sp. Leaf264]